MRETFAIRMVLKAHTLQERGIGLIDEANGVRLIVCYNMFLRRLKAYGCVRIYGFPCLTSKRLWFANPASFASLQKSPISPLDHLHTHATAPPSQHNSILLGLLFPCFLRLPALVHIPHSRSSAERHPSCNQHIMVKAGMMISHGIIHVSSNRYVRLRGAGETPMAGLGRRSLGDIALSL